MCAQNTLSPVYEESLQASPRKNCKTPYFEHLTPQVFNDRVLMSEPQKLKMSKLAERQNELETKTIKVSDFSCHIEPSLRLLESDPAFDVRNCLDRHSITGAIRARMVDWMTDVLSQFHCEEKTLFRSVQIMDRYFKNCSIKLTVHDLHAIGVTSMYLSSQ